MADSTMNDISKMKVVDLRKELKSRGLSYAGDKAELVARLQGAITQDDHGDINLDSDEIDSDGVLEDEDDKSHNDILEDSAVDTLNEELVLEETSPEKQPPETKPSRILKRKITSETPKPVENKEAGAKKIVLNRTISLTTNTAKPVDEKKDIEPPDNNSTDKTFTSSKIKISAETDTKTRMEMRAKRFGLPIKMTDEQRKEARKQRFNQNTISSDSSSLNITSSSESLAENLEKFKKRAERFGQSVSAIMTDIEKKEKLEKRKAKFGTVKI
ncbi:SAP domain-containing ribonucleoprotein [Vanessa tameamea]|uniref:SAP domain-containing ribonucleoprotein n=1 Tax=Vanessa tameamea TaxID=334116 RepID=A0A8B8ILK6_VANTA|nr:SAP domain-containing ribonucleoprotein [Vanessa tameamea]XP_047537636.1 SAP domain-containing ribonucleoprotein [Vanessa atalanta]